MSGGKGNRPEDYLWMYLHRIVLPSPSTETLERHQHMKSSLNCLLGFLNSVQQSGPGIQGAQASGELSGTFPPKDLL